MLNPSCTLVLETDRLRLRGHREEDLPNCVAMWSEDAVTRFTVGRRLTEEEIWLRMLRHVGHWTLLGFGYWVVEEKATGRFLGEAGMAKFHRSIQPSIAGTPEAGWVFASNAWGKGYALEPCLVRESVQQRPQCMPDQSGKRSFTEPCCEAGLQGRGEDRVSREPDVDPGQGMKHVISCPFFADH